MHHPPFISRSTLTECCSIKYVLHHTSRMPLEPGRRTSVKLWSLGAVKKRGHRHDTCCTRRHGPSMEATRARGSHAVRFAAAPRAGTRPPCRATVRHAALPQRSEGTSSTRFHASESMMPSGSVSRPHLPVRLPPSLVYWTAAIDATEWSPASLKMVMRSSLGA